MNMDDLVSLQNNRKNASNPHRFSLPIAPAKKEYAINKDKDGLSREQRAKVDDAKDMLTYPRDEDLF